MNVTIIKWLLESGGERKTERKRGMRGTKMSTFKEKRKKKKEERVKEKQTNKKKAESRGGQKDGIQMDWCVQKEG